MVVWRPSSGKGGQIEFHLTHGRVVDPDRVVAIRSVWFLHSIAKLILALT